MLFQVGVSFDLYYDARKHKIKIKARVIDAMLVANFRGNKFKRSYKADDRHGFNGNLRGGTFE